MEASRRSRLRLSRRRPPSGAGPPGPRLGALPDGDVECARLWTELLRTASADLDPDGESPPLPAFPGQAPRSGPERAAAPEVFTVGAETFSWTPLPSAPAGGERTGRSYRVFRGAGAGAGRSAREPRGTPDAPEQPPADRAPQTLRSCPMCQADFAAGLAQLDIDSHLAQCLADSTEDLVW